MLVHERGGGRKAEMGRGGTDMSLLDGERGGKVSCNIQTFTYLSEKYADLQKTLAVYIFLCLILFLS